MISVLRFLKKTAVLLISSYIIVCGTIYVLQGKLLYHPDTAMPSPQGAGLANAKSVHLKTADGRWR